MAKLPTIEQMKFRRYPPLKSGPPILWPTKRYFRRNEGSTDYATIPEVTLAGDWEFSVDFYRFGDSGGRFIFANYDSVSGSYGLNLYSSGDYSAGAGQLTLFSFSGTPTITGLSKNTFYSVRYKSVGGFVSAYLNGVLFDEGIVVAPAGISSANQAAVWGIPQGSGFRLEGILANLKIYDAGTLVRDYPLDDNSNILANRATSLGQELVDVGDVTLGVGWYIDGEDLVYSGTGTDLLTINTSLTSSETYLSSIKAAYGTFRDRLDQVNFTGVTESNRAFTYSGGILQMQSNGEPCRINIVSIRKADGYGTIINGNADDWGLFDRQADGDWKGNGLIVPPWDSVDQVLVTA